LPPDKRFDEDRFQRNNSIHRAKRHACQKPDVSPDGAIAATRGGGMGGACFRRRTISPNRPGGSRIAINGDALASSVLCGSGFMRNDVVSAGQNLQGAVI